MWCKKPRVDSPCNEPLRVPRAAGRCGPLVKETDRVNVKAALIDKEVLGIDMTALIQHFVMQVNSRRAPRHPHETDFIPT